jgi:hypothetical protein
MEGFTFSEEKSRDLDAARTATVPRGLELITPIAKSPRKVTATPSPI